MLGAKVLASSFFMVSGPPLKTLFCEPSSIRRPLCVDIDGTLRNLSVRKELLEALRESRGAGRKLLILTASSVAVARRLYADLDLFDDVVSLDGERPGTSKKDLLIAAYGEKGFDYLGDSTTDVGLFQAAYQGFLFGASP